MLRSGSWPSSTLSDASASSAISTRWAARAGKLAPQASGNRMDKMFGTRFRQVIEGNQALAEPVAAPAASEDQRHGGGGDGAIIVADEALQDACFAAPAARPRRGRDPLLVGASQEHGHQARLVDEARQRQRLDERRVTFVICGDPAAGQRGANRIGNIADEAVKHGGHQRPFLLGQALRRIEEEVTANGREPAPARGARGPLPSAAGAAMGHSSGIIASRLAESG